MKTILQANVYFARQNNNKKRAVSFGNREKYMQHASQKAVKQGVDVYAALKNAGKTMLDAATKAKDVVGKIIKTSATSHDANEYLKSKNK